MLKLNKFLLLLATILPIVAGAETRSWYDETPWRNDDRAYQWYPDNEKKPAKKAEEQEPTPQTATKPKEVEEYEKLKKTVEQSRVIAVMNPTPDNIKAYIQFHEMFLQKSYVFADQWRRTQLENPELDYSLIGRPNNRAAQIEYDSNRDLRTQASIKAMAKTHGIFFFYRGDCPYCHAMAPTLLAFAQQYGITIKAISMDGGMIDGLPNPVMDNGIGSKLGVKMVPAIFAADIKNKKYIPISYGVVSSSELEQRFLMQSNTAGAIY